MAKKKKDDIEKNDVINDASAEEVKTDSAAQQKTEEKSDEEKTDKSSAELAEAKDKFIRLAADFDNYKKRSALEKEALRAIVVSDTVQMMLPILDDLERALDSAKDEKSAVKDGVTMILQKAKTAFDAFGIKDFGKRGDDFDPEMHNAIMTCADEELGEGKIAEVLQKGYKIDDKIIRHALVKVSE